MAISTHEIDIRFAPAKTDPQRVAIKDEISAAAHQLALLIHQLVPGSREESQAIKAVEIAVQWSHDGIDRRKVLPGDRDAATSMRSMPHPDSQRAAS